MITNCSGEGKKNEREKECGVALTQFSCYVRERGMLKNGCSCPKIGAIEYVTISIPWAID